MRNKRTGGLSAFEIWTSIILLAVVSTTAVAFIAPLHDQSRRERDQQQIALLNAAVQKFYAEQGCWPDRRLHALVREGYHAPHQANFPHIRTPLGSIYLFDLETKQVFNPIVRREQRRP